MKSLIARLRARFVAWLLPDIEGHLIVRSMNFNNRPLDPKRRLRDPQEFIYPRLRSEAPKAPTLDRKRRDTKSDLPAPRAPYRHIR